MEGLFESPLSPCCKEPVEQAFAVLDDKDPFRAQGLVVLIAWTCSRCGQEGGTFMDKAAAKLLKQGLTSDKTL